MVIPPNAPFATPGPPRGTGGIGTQAALMLETTGRPSLTMITAVHLPLGQRTGAGGRIGVSLDPSTPN